MDLKEKAFELLQQLAIKLNTTIENLWGVMVKQGRVEAISSLISIILIWGFGVFLYILHKRFIKKKIYDEYELLIGAPMIIGAIIFSFMLLYSLSCISDVITGFLNPDYWALKQLFEII